MSGSTVIDYRPGAVLAATHTAMRRGLTVAQAVALQAALGDLLPEGSIVIRRSSPLDPEESTAPGCGETVDV